MALTTLNLATLPLKFAIPVLAGLAAGTGGVAAYVTAPATSVAALPSTSPAPVASEQGQAAPTKPHTKPSCERETWPYIDNRCITRRGNEPERKVRFVMAPRASDVANTAAPNLVTSDTVLRGPEANEQPAVKKPSRRSESRRSGRDEFRRVYSVYSVPSRGSQKPVIVVRPLRLNTFSSRF